MKVYKIYEIAYRYGDEESRQETLFTTSEVRDQYFNELYKMMKENSHQTEIENSSENEFEYTDNGKWSYETIKTDEIVKIIESFEIDDKGIFSFSYVE